MTQPKDILTFIQESSGMELYPVQRVLLKAAYGIPLDNYKPIVGYRKNYTDKPQLVTEAEYLKILHAEGRCNIDHVVEGELRRKMILPLGRRSGKEMLSYQILNYELYKLLLKDDPHAYYRLPSKCKILLKMVSYSKESAEESFEEWKRHAVRTAKLRLHMTKLEDASVRFQTIDDQRYDPELLGKPASVKVNSRTCLDKGLKGSGHLMIVFDEPDLFVNDAGKRNYDEMYTASFPTLSTFYPRDSNGGPTGPCEGVLVNVGSPTANSIFKSEFDWAVKHPEGELFFNAPTWEMNPVIDTAFFDREQKKAEIESAPERFRRSYGAEFDL